MRVQKTSFGRFADTILTGEHAGAPGGRNVDFIKVLAIPGAQAAARRHRAAPEGEADFRPRRPRGIVNYSVCRRLHDFDVFRCPLNR